MDANTVVSDFIGMRMGCGIARLWTVVSGLHRAICVVRCAGRAVGCPSVHTISLVGGGLCAAADHLSCAPRCAPVGRYKALRPNMMLPCAEPCFDTIVLYRPC